ncbi:MULTISPECIES: prenyltransferase/squalene oxidase repeat-containing protein [Paenibacillus]|uniref:Uncharacterized protein n=1 Tax=Paenibacillus azoreducens TaxID=116718 RepID=A0A919Y8C8_9BACL|nr:MULTISPECIES: prenyltransferase/squalene oxidase repeat-containing protein [Paenibacillus]MBE9915646.1 terpene cyclase/mutase family protein [Paenibacillus donghaensis]GIO46851.1 hypothetical protein J34TS1_16160 [Paenibacillus azoreducens]
MSLSKSIEYVKQNSTDPFDIVRLKNILDRKIPDDEELVGLIKSQRQDGSWSPFWAKDSSSLDATCYRLAMLEQAGIKTHPVIERAIEFITKQMNEMGYFEENNIPIDMCPPWVMPGDIKARLYLTANCGFWINHYSSNIDNRIITYLREHIDINGNINSYLHTNWLIGGLFYSLGLFKEAEAIFQCLCEQFPKLSSDNLAWLINTLIVSGVNNEEEIIKKSITRLIELRNNDGSWSSDDGSLKDIHTTIESIRALSCVGIS